MVSQVSLDSSTSFGPFAGLWGRTSTNWPSDRNRAHVARLLRVVAQGRSQLGHRHGQARVPHHRFRPELSPDVLLAQGLGARPDEQVEQLEGLRLEVHFRSVPEELAAVGVQDELAEAEFQGRPRALSNLLGSR